MCVHVKRALIRLHELLLQFMWYAFELTKVRKLIV